MIINKRLKRELKKNCSMYIAVLLVVMIGIGVISAFIISADSVTKIVKDAQKNSNLEDGSFDTMVELSNKNIEKVKKYAEIESLLYTDIEDNKITYRVSRIRKNIDKINLTDGRISSADSQIVVENQFAKKHNIKVGSRITLDGKKFTVSGLGFTSDYSFLLKNKTDLNADTEFCPVYLTENAAKEFLDKSKNKSYHYAYKYVSGGNKKNLKRALKGYGLMSLIEAGENNRINGAVDDVATNKSVALIEGVILSLLIAFLLTVVSVNQVERDSKIIGTLSALGYVKRKLISHFIKLPCIIVMIGSALGFALGIFISPVMVMSDEFSYGDYTVHCKLFVIIYSLLFPLAVTYIVNCIVLNKRLSKKPVKLLKREKKVLKTSKLKLKKLKFATMYRVKQVMKEWKINIVMLIGLLLSSLILILGISVPSSINYYAKNVKNQMKSEYIYMLYKPLNDREFSSSQKAFSKGFSKEIKKGGSKFDITLMGIENNNEYFDFSGNVHGKGLYISDSVSMKYGLKKGDTFKLVDNEKKYSFKIADVVPYSNGLYIFMDRSEMCKVFQKNNNYYNTVFSDKKLSIDKSMTYSVITKKDVVKMADKWRDGLIPLSGVMIVASVLIFVVIMFLMMKIIIERSQNSIALVKIFGFNKKEIKKMYLGSGLYVVLLSVIIGVPLNSILAGRIFPMFVSDSNAGIPCHIAVYLYFLCIVVITVSYLISNAVLMKKLNKMSYSEILRDRD